VIPALDPLVITSVRPVHILEGGTYPLVGFRFTAGPYKGYYGYVMENFVPHVRVGQHLKRGQSIGTAQGKYPYIETGFASGPEGSPLAPLSPTNPHGATGPGIVYASYISSRIGSPLTSSQPSPGKGRATAGGGTKAASGGGFWSDVKGVLTWNPIPNPASDAGAAVGSAASGVASATVGVGDFLVKLLDPHFWLRALEVMGGLLLVLLGLYLLARNVGLAQPVEDAGRLLPGRQLSESAAASLQKSPGTAAAEAAPRRRRSVDVSEAGSRRQAIRRRSELARPSDEIPF